MPEDVAGEEGWDGGAARRRIEHKNQNTDVCNASKGSGKYLLWHASIEFKMKLVYIMYPLVHVLYL